MKKIYLTLGILLISSLSALAQADSINISISKFLSVRDARPHEEPNSIVAYAFVEKRRIGGETLKQLIGFLGDIGNYRTGAETGDNPKNLPCILRLDVASVRDKGHELEVLLFGQGCPTNGKAIHGEVVLKNPARHLNLTVAVDGKVTSAEDIRLHWSKGNDW